MKTNPSPRDSTHGLAPCCPMWGGSWNDKISGGADEQSQKLRGQRMRGDLPQCGLHAGLLLSSPISCASLKCSCDTWEHLKASKEKFIVRVLLLYDPAILLL